MLKKLKIITILLLIFIAKLSWAANPEVTGLHLSYEQRLMVTYALLAQGETEEKKEAILLRAKDYFSGVAKKGFQTVQVENFQQFLELFKGEWPDTNSVLLDVEKIEARGPQAIKVFKARSARVQRQIDRYLHWQMGQMKKMLLSEVGNRVQVLEQIEPSELSTNSLSMKFPEKWVLQQIERFLFEKMKELDSVGEKIAQSGFSSKLDATTRISLQTLLSEYFSRLGLASKKLIVSSFLGSNLYADNMMKFEIMVQNSGPQLQKLLQAMAQQSELDPEILEVFHRLENSVRSVPWSQVEAILEEEKHNWDFISFEHKPMAVGTMAQVHRAKILVDGQVRAVVVRFIKPGIEERIKEDQGILFEIAQLLDSNPEFRKTGAPKLTPIVQDVTMTVVAELNQKDTIRRQIIGIESYEKEALIAMPGYKNYIQFHVPRVYTGKSEKTKFMVQEYINGSKLDTEVQKYTEMPDLKRLIVEEMAKVWAYEIQFGGGFYHSDLHQGNFMIRLTEPKIVVNILDFGMGGVISPDMQQKMMMLGAGIEILSAELIARSYWSISDQNENKLSEEEFNSLVKERVKKIANTPEATSLELWTAWTMNNGLKLPYEFISINRGVVFLNKLLKSSGSELTVNKILEIFGRRKPFLSYNHLVMKEHVSNKDFIRLSWKEFKKMTHTDSPAKVKANATSCETVF
ncbi:MAG: AarF/ABC1/UbiB kinase family protein [Pseudobdellovibrionaceae bacterium]